MKLEEMKRIADARTKGEWFWSGNTYGEYLKSRNGEDILLGIDAETGLYKKASEEDEAFIAMAANNWDKLMKVVEAAKEYCECEHDHILGYPYQELLTALEELEKE